MEAAVLWLVLWFVAGFIVTPILFWVAGVMVAAGMGEEIPTLAWSGIALAVFTAFGGIWSIVHTVLEIITIIQLL